MKKTILILLVLVTITGCVDNIDDASQETEKITKSFVLLEKHQVKSFKKTSSCNVLIFQKGAYVDRGCRGYTNTRDFDEQSLEIFDSISTYFADTKVREIYNLVYEDGKLVYGNFELISDNYPDRHRYVYQPGHSVKSLSLPKCLGELDSMKIDDNWFFECEEWN